MRTSKSIAGGVKSQSTTHISLVEHNIHIGRLVIENEIPDYQIRLAIAVKISGNHGGNICARGEERS
jgi:hypothetical protein